MSQPLCHYIIKNVAVKVKIIAEYNLNSDIFNALEQLSGYGIVM